MAILLISLKLLFSYFIPTPTAFGDCYTYSKMADSFLHNGNFLVHGIEITKYPPLYSVILSPAFLFKDMHAAYFAIKSINALISTLIIFPAFFLARKFLAKKYAFAITLLIGIFPSFFSFSGEIMSENLFYPIFIAVVFFLHECFEDKRLRWKILAGIFAGFLILTKNIGMGILAIIPLYFCALALFKKQTIDAAFKNTVIILTFAALIFVPWLIRNYLVSDKITEILGSSTTGYFTSIVSINFIASFCVWFVLYSAYILIAGMYIFPVASVLFAGKSREDSLIPFSILTAISSFIIIALASLHSASTIPHFWILNGRPLGRYIDTVLPLLFIFGTIFLVNAHHFNKKRVLLATIPLLMAGSFLAIYPLFPVNAFSLTWLGVIASVLQFVIGNTLIMALLVFILLALGAIILIWKVNGGNQLQLKLLSLFLIFAFLTSTLAFGAVIYNSRHYWYQNPLTQAGIWFHDFDKGKSTVLIDSLYEGQITKIGFDSLYEISPTGQFATIFGFWMRNELMIGNPYETDADYIFTKRKLDMQKVYEGKNKIYIYENSKEN